VQQQAYTAHKVDELYDPLAINFSGLTTCHTYHRPTPFPLASDNGEIKRYMVENVPRRYAGENEDKGAVYAYKHTPVPGQEA
jgi:hypothetical protein